MSSFRDASADVGQRGPAGIQQRRLRALSYAVVQDGPVGHQRAEQQDVNLFSDLLVHNMGPGLADEVSQGAARGDEFRTAPLWGLGKRIFFLHDGRTDDLVTAIRAHRSAANSQFRASEANTSVDVFNSFSEGTKQNLLNFLRSL